MLSTWQLFQPALPMRGVTASAGVGVELVEFQPALPMRGVTMRAWNSRYSKLFQPALPMRGVTVLAVLYSARVIFQPALPMRGVTVHQRAGHAVLRISTRTPHAGSDGLRHGVRAVRVHISTRTPHAGSDGKVRLEPLVDDISTRTPHAGSDAHASSTNYPVFDFNPHSPCGE